MHLKKNEENNPSNQCKMQISDYCLSEGNEAEFSIEDTYCSNCHQEPPTRSQVKMSRKHHRADNT